MTKAIGRVNLLSHEETKGTNLQKKKEFSLDRIVLQDEAGIDLEANTSHSVWHLNGESLGEWESSKRTPRFNFSVCETWHGFALTFCSASFDSANESKQ